jgi:hypothetical protein
LHTRIWKYDCVLELTFATAECGRAPAAPGAVELAGAEVNPAEPKDHRTGLLRATMVGTVVTAPGESYQQLTVHTKQKSEGARKALIAKWRVELGWPPKARAEARISVL